MTYTYIYILIIKYIIEGAEYLTIKNNEKAKLIVYICDEIITYIKNTENTDKNFLKLHVKIEKVNVGLEEEMTEVIILIDIENEILKIDYDKDKCLHLLHEGVEIKDIRINIIEL